jgi:hypothetical protein
LLQVATIARRSGVKHAKGIVIMHDRCERSWSKKRKVANVVLTASGPIEGWTEGVEHSPSILAQAPCLLLDIQGVSGYLEVNCDVLRKFCFRAARQDSARKATPSTAVLAAAAFAVGVWDIGLIDNGKLR